MSDIDKIFVDANLNNFIILFYGMFTILLTYSIIEPKRTHAPD